MSDENEITRESADEGAVVPPPIRLFAANARLVPAPPTNLLTKSFGGSNDLEPIIGQPVPAPPPEPLPPDEMQSSKED